MQGTVLKKHKLLSNPISFKSKKDIPPQYGNVVLITGGTGGLGYETALALAQAGAALVITGRNEKKGKIALRKILAAYPPAKISFIEMDLGSLASIRTFAKTFLRQYQVLDILVNNAGIMGSSKRKTTFDGFEIQLGTNHLGHFLLTSLLLPALKRSKYPRVVNVSDKAADSGKINLGDLNYEVTPYAAWATYSQSKLANLLFTFELQRQSDERGWGLTAIAAHPGISRTGLIPNEITGIKSCAFKLLVMLVGQSAEKGALPQLFAATDPNAEPGGYYGPQRWKELRGLPGIAKVPVAAKDLYVAKRLWDISCLLTDAKWVKEGDNEAFSTSGNNTRSY